MRYADTLVERARSVLPPEVFRYVAAGAGRGDAAAEAADAWRAVRVVPRVLRDVTQVDLEVDLLGTVVRAPVCVAPTTLQRAVHARGEVAMAEAVHAAESLLVVSSNAGSTFEEIGATGVPWWLQMYVTADRSLTEPVVRRAVAAGARAVVVTADTPVVGTKDLGSPAVWDVVDPATLRVNLGHAPDAPGAEKARDLGPQDVAWLAETFGAPVVVKGVLHPDDARRCVAAGASAVWVSNHGGRQLDRAVATAHALPGVAEAVGDLAEVYVDGGVGSGEDVLVAGLLGARACFLGRGPLYALAADGAPGVTRLLDETATELVEALRLGGLARPLRGALEVRHPATNAWGDPGFDASRGST